MTTLMNIFLCLLPTFILGAIQFDGHHILRCLLTCILKHLWKKNDPKVEEIFMDRRVHQKWTTLWCTPRLIGEVHACWSGPFLAYAITHGVDHAWRDGPILVHATWKSL